MNNILVGAIAMCTLTVGLFFLRFWRTTRDRFFLFFALSFLIDGVDRILLGVFSLSNGEGAPLIYLIRLVAYSMLLFAIIDKNRRRDRDS